MRRSILLQRLYCAGALLLLAALPASAASRQRNVPDSFLKYPAHSVDEFMAQFDADPVLRQRLVKHFRMPEAQLAKYLRTELTDVELTSSGTRTVYGVNWTGRIYPVVDSFAKGAPALGLRDGTPMFKLPCGNPIEIETSPSEAFTGTPAPPLTQLIAVPLETAVLPVESILHPTIPFAPRFQVPVTTKSSRFFPFWWPPGGGGGEAPPPPPPPEVVPEPATLILFGVGLSVLGGRFVRRRR